MNIQAANDHDHILGKSLYFAEKERDEAKAQRNDYERALLKAKKALAFIEELTKDDSLNSPQHEMAHAEARLAQFDIEQALEGA